MYGFKSFHWKFQKILTRWIIFIKVIKILNSTRFNIFFLIFQDFVENTCRLCLEPMPKMFMEDIFFTDDSGSQELNELIKYTVGLNVSRS